MRASIEPRPLRVLVVDDDSDTVDSTAQVLQLIGHQVETALNGAQAVASVLTFRPDVAMLDLAMPTMDGFQTARQIQSLVIPRQPVLIAVSGYGDIRTKRQAAEAGFDLHLLKPIETSVLEELRVVLDETEGLANRVVEQQQKLHEATLLLARSYIQMGHSLLHVAKITRIASNREQSVSKVRRICDRLMSWVERFPHLRVLRDDLEDLIRHLPR